MTSGPLRVSRLTPSRGVGLPSAGLSACAKAGVISDHAIRKSFFYKLSISCDLFCCLTKQDQSPAQGTVSRNLKCGDTRRRAPIRARHAARIKEKDATPPLIPRHMGVGVQEHVDILRRLVRRDVNEPKTKAVALQVDEQRPLGIAVAIAAHKRERWPDIFQPNDDARRADIAQMPDLVRPFGQLFQILGQVVVGVGQDENA